MPKSHHTGVPVKCHKENPFQYSTNEGQYKIVADNQVKNAHQWGAKRHRSLTTNGLVKDDRTGAKEDPPH
ncbi:hypothetical protein [Ferruginibacter sp. HRS2-29]|uniref:hypothetical protein n=1 Tax=Ferruginibacter sp. HRS2-29 TaxID=2487334 RepID=UPI0020CBEFC7|nr:hypothetical protein [Ferruginibacter sp. HRS2-29]MCP9749881.1 hypothetical protein [Ferruginibacter sp. HRS2-29]